MAGQHNKWVGSGVKKVSRKYKYKINRNAPRYRCH